MYKDVLLVVHILGDDSVPNWSETYMVAWRFELLAFGEASVRTLLRSVMIKMWRRIILNTFS